MWREPRRGLVKKRKLERELISEAEIFLEAVPTTFTTSYIIGNLYSNKSNIRARILIGADTFLFLFTWLTSIISASIGMAKVFKVRISQN